MIIKYRNKPLKIQTYEAFLTRLSQNHYKRHLIESDFGKYNAGFQGEKATDYQLQYICPSTFNIIQNLRLKVDGITSQNDSVVYSKKQFNIIEAKNYSGEVIFDEAQVIKINNNGKKESYTNPIWQVQRQEHMLRKWLNYNNFPSIPINSFVVITNPTTIFDVTKLPPNLAKKVIGIDALPWKIQELDEKIKYTKYNTEQFNLVGEKLVQDHKPEKIDILSKYGVNKDEIILGAKCPKCNALPLELKNNKWKCINNCKVKTKDIVQHSLIDYSLLISSSFSNSEFREFFNLPSQIRAKNILKNINLIQTGKCKHTRYHLPLTD
ncbi:MULTISPECIES: nuclease-related domain-containing protein [Bacillus]|uniref:nuclease-related domain-containing protein n=1 Tax=Bacillus TaxID=1386 RepID=UPI000BB82207|nr:MULTISPECIES: nuclease-related domain-containing protein [Bacillus]